MTQESLLDQTNHFAFGKNWCDYAEKIDDARIAQAITDLQRMCGRQDLRGKTFLDIGCGSGLHALAAVRLGATRVLGVDIDPDSVAASKATFARFAPTAPSAFEVCSVFDMHPDARGTFDIVYSWGVLHHTGDMTRAITAAAALVAPDGEFLVALYKKTPFCGMWKIIKRWYSHSSTAAQKRAQNMYIFLQKIMARIKGKNYDAYVRNYSSSRGMDYYNDIHDWLGGYPYESISPTDCYALMAGLGFSVEREFLNTIRFPYGLGGTGCDEYVFRRAHAK